MKNLNYRLNPTSGAGGGAPINSVNAAKPPFKGTSDKVSDFIETNYPAVHKSVADETIEGSLTKLQGQTVQVGIQGQSLSDLKMPQQ